MKKDNFHKKIKNYKNRLLKNLDNFEFDSNIFYKIELNSINFLIAKRINSYQGRELQITKEDKDKFENEILFPFENINLNNENALSIDNFAYAEYIQKYFERIMLKIFKKNEGKDFNQEIQLLETKKISNQKILNDFLFEYTYGLLKYFPNKETYFNTFMKFNSNINDREIISDLYNSFSAVKKGMDSPDFQLIDNKDQLFSLNNFKGKLTYIDVWATWCKPCVEDYNEMVELNKIFGNKINIVSIAYLDTRKRWGNFLNIKNPKWKQLFSLENKQDFFKKYNITGVPRYILLDERSKIISSNAEKPGNIQEIIKNLIE
jgi:thiol-disulfide isomerase/thioredoxin